MKAITRLTKHSVKRAAALGLGLLAWGAVVAGPAVAGTDTDNLSVTATVTANCTITTSAVAFGAYDPAEVNLSAAKDGTGSVSVRCTTGSSGTITLGQGSNADTDSSDAVPLRQMASGENRLAYFLYQDSGRTTVWGNTAGTGVVHNGTGNLTAITVYGRILGAQNVPAGSYSDTVVATVTF